ncbi:MAG: hypothetical protein IJO91_01230 [Oscillospiraceae bacterium]|nr:hypothetical protein [Oscillospiraceae bacterium]
MNVNFEKAIRYIDMGSYNKAVDSLNAAIEEAKAAGNTNEAIQYKCVLGELYAQLEMATQATAALKEVVAYCDENRCLYEQRAIAQKYLIAYETGTIEAVLNAQPAPAPAAKPAAQKVERPGYTPLVPKPTQDKSFITKQMSKKRR